MRFRNSIRATSSLAVLALLAFAGQAHAQDQSTPSPAPATEAEEDEPATVDQIVVTAQKREQNLQDVPVVVTTISEELLEDAGVRDIQDLQILAPGLTVTSTSNQSITTARIRGIGTVGDNPGLESSVLVVIDGVYRPRNGVGFGDLGQLQRIEILKGPQGTLFGKNASSGVINILTEAPSFNFGAEGELTVGNYGLLGVQASVTGPIVGDTVAGRLYVGKRERDGFLDVVTGPGPRTYNQDVDQDFYTIRGQILANPNDQLDVRLIGDFTKRDEYCCLGTQLFVGQAANSRAALINQVRPGSLDTTNTPFDRRAYGNRDTNQKIEDKGVSLQADYDVTPDIAFTSITGLRDWEAITGQDSDFTAADIVYRPNTGENFVQFGQFSQEFRFAGRRGPLDWLVGAFYAREDLEAGSSLLYGSDYYAYFASRVLGGVPGAIGLTPAVIFQPGNGARDRYDQEGNSWAVFTDNTYSVTEALKLTLGLRYTVDEKDLSSRYTTTGASCDQAEAAFPLLAANPALGATPAARQAAALRVVGGLCLNHQNNDFDELGTTNQSRSEEALTGTAKLTYHVNDDIMTYGSYSRGFKAGGFNLDREQRIVLTPTGPNFTADPDTSFRGEYVNSFELGAKTTLADNRLLLNATLFHQTFEDFQLNTFVGTAFIVETLPEVVSRGIDTDFIYLSPIEGLSLQGGVTYAETQISEFTAADLIDPSRFTSLHRLPGARLSFAPLWSASLAGTYERELGTGLMFRSNLSMKTVSGYNTGSDLHPVKHQEGYTLVNARVGLGTADGRWTVEAWAQNLGDVDYLQVGFNGPFQVDEANDDVSVYDAFLGQPRTFGLTLRVKY